MNRRQFLAAGLFGAAASSIGGAEAARPTTAPPGVVDRRDYDLWCSGTAPAPDGDRIVVGRKGTRPDAEDPVDVVVLENGDVLHRTTFTPDLPDESHATPDVVRTADGYAVAAGPWLARLRPDLSVRSIGANPDIAASKQTKLLALPEGFVVGFTEWLPNAFWTHLLGFGPDGEFRWYEEYDENGSQALDFLVPGHNGGALAGGTYPWLASIGTDGSLRTITLPDSLPSGVLNAGVRDGNGVVLCSGSETARLDANFDLDWHQRYDALSDAYVVDLLPTADDGFLFSTVENEEDGIRLSKAGPDGTLRWTHAYRLGDEAEQQPHVLAEVAAGEYLVLGGYRLAREGWVLHLSTAVRPTATATPTGSEPVVTYSTETTTPTPSTTPETIVNSPPRSTTTSVPGFGPAVATLSVGGAVLLRALRTNRDD